MFSLTVDAAATVAVSAAFYWVLALVLCALMVIVALQSFVLIEMVRQFAQVRARLDMDDRPVSQNLGEYFEKPVPASLAPFASNTARRGVLFVFLTTHCSTCRGVASGLTNIADEFKETLELLAIVQAPIEERVDAFLADVGLNRSQVIVDLEAALGAEIGLEVRPLGIMAHDGYLIEAAAIRNPTQLRRLAESVKTRLEEPTRSEVDFDSMKELAMRGGVRK